jgi:Chitobiase/beta-hexosaminidase C-terminal domain
MSIPRMEEKPRNPRLYSGALIKYAVTSVTRRGNFRLSISAIPIKTWVNGKHATWRVVLGKREPLAGSRIALVLNVVFVTMALAALAGCGFSGLATGPPAPVTLHGAVFGGQQPVGGSSVQLYAAGISGVGSTALPLLNNPARSNSDGSFSLTAKCPSSTSELYVVAKGGNPGLAAGTDNPAIELIAVLGPCNAASGDYVLVNEATTVGSVWPVSPFMISSTQLGYPSSGSSFSAAVTKVSQLVDLTHGISPGNDVPAGYAVQTGKLYTLADALSSCVTSTGGVAGDGTPCGLLFSLAKTGDTAPATTADAALRLAQNQNLSLGGLFDLAPHDSAFQPTLPETPGDWNLDLVPIPAAPIINPSSGTYATGQKITLSGGNSGATIYYTLDGSKPSLNSSVYSSPLVLSTSETVTAIAVNSDITSSTASANFAVSATHLVFSAQPSNTTVGAPFNPSPALSVVDNSGNIVTTSNVAITLNLSGGAGLNGTTTVNAGHGTAVFSGLSVSSAGTGLTLTASGPGLPGAVSTGFNVISPASPVAPVSASITLSLPVSSIDTGDTVNGSVTLSQPAGASSVTVTLSSSSPANVAIPSSFLTIAAGQTTTSFAYTGIAAGSSTLTASATGYATASAPVSVVTPTQTSPHLAFVTQPSDTTVGFSIAPSIIVIAEDTSGNPTTTSSVPVTLTLSSNPGGGALGGSLTANTGATAAVFSNLSISQPGTGFTLIASSPGLASATSATFNINPANTGAIYYVSNSGSDSNDGTSPASPWQSISKVNSAVFPAGSQVLFQSTGVWHEQLNANGGIRYGAYGPSGNCTLNAQLVASCASLPIIDGADIVAGWSAYNGATYRAPYSALASKGFVDSMYSQTTPLTLVHGAANVVGTAGTIYSDGAYVYVHLLDGSNPASHTVEVAGSRAYGILVNGAANTVVDGLEVIRTAKSGYLSYAYSGTGASNVVQNSVFFNNGDSLTDPKLNGPVEGAILSVAGHNQAPVAGFVASNNWVGRVDIPHNTLNYTWAGIQVNGMAAPEITGNKVASVNGWAIRVQDFFANSCRAPIVAGNETVNSEGNVGVAGCPNAVVEFNSMHDTFGNAVQAGAGLVLTNLGTGLSLRYNNFKNIRPAYSAGLYNGIDINYIANGLAIGNTCLNVSNDCMTLEADSAPSGGWTVTNNTFDASQNMYATGDLPTPEERVYPFYIRNTSLAAGLTMHANMLVVNAISPYIKYGAASGIDQTHDLTQPAFNVACPGCEITGTQ